MRPENRTAADRVVLFLAEGFGAGRIPVAPGTFGTLVGFGWIYVLLLAHNLLFYFGGIIIGFFLAVWLGGRAEEILGRKDPGSIVIDEITALPLAFAGAVIALAEGMTLPGFAQFLSLKTSLGLFVAFIGFRVFDVTKPWWIGRSQRLPGGWGLVVDDFLAALPVVPLTYLSAKLF